MHSIIIIFLIKASERNAKGKKIVEVTWGCYYSLFENKTIEHFPQCLIFAHTPPGGCPTVKYSVSTSHHLRFV
jgi:hypothetical protein